MKKISLAFPFFLVIFEVAAYMSNDAYLPALPKLMTDYLVNQDMVMYTVSVWCLGMSLSLFWGPVSDRYGRRHTMTLGIFLFSLATIVCAVTQQFWLFMIARFVQGLSTNTISVAGYASVHESYDTRSAIKLTAVMTAISVVAPAVGPVWGAWMMSFTHWRSIFHVLLVGAMISFVGIWVSMHETLKKPQPIHVRQIAKRYFAILGNKNFQLITLSLSLYMIVFLAWIVETPFIIMTRYKQPASTFGIIQFIVYGTMIVFSPIASWMHGRFQIDRVISWGYAVFFLGTCLVCLSANLLESWWYCVYAMAIVSVGASMLWGVLYRFAFESVPDETMGLKSALASMMVSFGAFLGSYLVTWINAASFINLSYFMLFFSTLLVGLYMTVLRKRLRMLINQCVSR